MTGASGLGPDVTGRFFAQVDDLNMAKDQNLAKASQKPGIATYQDGTIVGWFAKLFGQVVEVDWKGERVLLNKTSLEKFIQRNSGETDYRIKYQSSEEIIDKIITTIAKDDNATVYGLKKELTTPLKVVFSKDISGEPSRVFSFINAVEREAGIELPKKKMQEWFPPDRRDDGRITISAQEFKEALRHSTRSIQHPPARGHLSKEIQAFVNSTKKFCNKANLPQAVMFEPAEVSNAEPKAEQKKFTIGKGRTIVPAVQPAPKEREKEEPPEERPAPTPAKVTTAQEQSAALKIAQGTRRGSDETVEQVLQRIDKTAEIMSVVRDAKATKGNPQGMCRQLLKQIPGFSAQTQDSQARTRYISQIDDLDLDTTEHNLLIDLMIKTGDFKEEQVKELEGKQRR